jgi:membrane protein implicated in regulation of membrane protease activity
MNSLLDEDDGVEVIVGERATLDEDIDEGANLVRKGGEIERCRSCAGEVVDEGV